MCIYLRVCVYSFLKTVLNSLILLFKRTVRNFYFYYTVEEMVHKFCFFLLPKHILLLPAQTVILGSQGGQQKVLMYAFKETQGRNDLEVGPRFIWV